jgi:hypothetical protein
MIAPAGIPAEPIGRHDRLEIVGLKNFKSL